MIITLTKADFSLCKIGTLTTFNVRKSTVIGASVNIIKTSVERAGYSSATTIATIVLDEANYEGHAIKVMMGSTDVSSWYSVGKVIVPAKTPITSNITISVSATAVSGGDPIIPDVPVTPTMYTFTINPMVANATVTLTASGYKQSGNSISVPSGTTVSWTVSADGYFDKNGSETVTKDKTLNVDLGKIPGPEQPGSGNTGGTVQNIDLSTLSLNHCSSSKIGTSNKENLVYNNETHALTCNSGGWYKCSYFTTPVTEGMEIEFESNASSSVTGNFFAIWAADELVDGISEVNGSFWPAASFGIYASGGTGSASTEPLFMWSTTVKKEPIESYLATAMNGKTVKYIIRNTGIEVYIDNTKLNLPANFVLDSSKTYYFGMRHTCSNSSAQCSKMLYMGPIR